MKKKGAEKMKSRYDKCAYVMIFPAYCIFTIFILVPIAVVFYYSVTNFNMYTAPELVGLKNYGNLFTDEDFLLSIKNTLFYSVFTLFPQLAIGLLVADRKSVV